MKKMNQQREQKKGDMNMWLKLILTGVIVILSFSVLGCSESGEAGSTKEAIKEATVVLVCDDFQLKPHESEDVVLGVDGTLTVTLCSRPATGFQWIESSQINDTSILRQENYENEPPTNTGTVAASAKDTWIFKTLKKGTTTISFEYGHPSEGGEKGKWTFDLKVQVRE